MKIFGSYLDKLKYFIYKGIYWKISNFSTNSSWLALTYANDKKTDGVGSQLHRIYGIYAASRLLHLPYIHSPLLRVDYQGLSALEENNSDSEFASRFNKLFSIPSDLDLPKTYITYEAENLNLKIFSSLKKEAESNKIFTLLRIINPYGVIDIYPEAYQFVEQVSPFRIYQKKSTTICIGIHVRRGDLFAAAPDRLLPNSYYLSLVRTISRIFDELRLNYTFELHTEVPTNSFTVTKDHHGVFDLAVENMVISPELSKLEDFDTIPRLEKIINADPIESIRRMATSDVLIMSRSSFSYLGAILNFKGIIIYHDFWHPMLNDWIRADSSGNFSKKKFLKRFEELSKV